MRSYTLIVYIVFLISLINLSHGQVIKGQIIVEFLDDYEPLPGVTILVDSIYHMSDIDGLFIIDSLLSYPDSIMFSCSFNMDLKIINLPDNYDTLDLAKIELIKSKIISPSKYDSLRSELIETYEQGIIIVQQNKADRFLKDKYEPIHDWDHIVGYLVKGEYEKNSVIHPYDKNKKIELDFNDSHNLFILDYKLLNE